MLIAGGDAGESGDVLSAELFDPANDAFTALPASGSTELHTFRDGAVAAPLPDGQVLIAGGQTGGGPLQSAELFNPANDTFTALPASGSTELQTARAFAVAAPLPDGQVLIAGGQTGDVPLQSAELFDPANDTFTALAASGSTELQTVRIASCRRAAAQRAGADRRRRQRSRPLAERGAVLLGAPGRGGGR